MHARIHRTVNVHTVHTFSMHNFYIFSLLLLALRAIDNGDSISSWQGQPRNSHSWHLAFVQSLHTMGLRDRLCLSEMKSWHRQLDVSVVLDLVFFFLASLSCSWKFSMSYLMRPNCSISPLISSLNWFILAVFKFTDVFKRLSFFFFFFIYLMRR